MPFQHRESLSVDLASMTRLVGIGNEIPSKSWTNLPVGLAEDVVSILGSRSLSIVWEEKGIGGIDFVG